MKKPTIFIIVIMGVALVGGIAREFYNKNHHTVHALKNNPLDLRIGTALPKPTPLSPFYLEDMEGYAFTLDSLKGHWSFLFFGFTNCPNICPTTLATLQNIAQRLTRLPAMQYIFITIDPIRDNKDRLKNYLGQNYPGILKGITGNPDAIFSFCEKMGVHRGQDHSSTLFLINPEGKLAAVFTDSSRPQAIAQDVREIMHYYAVIVKADDFSARRQTNEAPEVHTLVREGVNE